MFPVPLYVIYAFATHQQQPTVLAYKIARLFHAILRVQLKMKSLLFHRIQQAETGAKGSILSYNKMAKPH